jgi:hypothetical protein
LLYGRARSKFPLWVLQGLWLLVTSTLLRNKVYIDCCIFIGWCDYLVCDAIACPEDLTVESRVRNEVTSSLHDDLAFGPSVGTIADPDYEDDDWM